MIGDLDNAPSRWTARPQYNRAVASPTAVEVGYPDPCFLWPSPMPAGMRPNVGHDVGDVMMATPPQAGLNPLAIGGRSSQEAPRRGHCALRYGRTMTGPPARLEDDRATPRPGTADSGLVIRSACRHSGQQIHAPCSLTRSACLHPARASTPAGKWRAPCRSASLR